METTGRIQQERRQQTLTLLAKGLVDSRTENDVLEQVMRVAQTNPADIRFVTANEGSTDDQGVGPMVTLNAADLGLTQSFSLTFGLNAQVPFDAAYRHFLEQFAASAGAAMTQVLNVRAREIATADRNRLLMDATVGACVLIGKELVYELANQAYCNIIDRNDILGKSFAEVFPESVGSDVQEIFLAVYRTGTPYISEEAHIRLRRSGVELQDCYYSYNIAPLRSSDGMVYGLMVIAIDITHQVVSRKEIERLNADLNIAARMKDEFLAMLGHELRNPLAPIVTALQIKHPAASSGVLTALSQSAGFQPAFAPRSGELNPQRLMKLRDSTVTREQAIIKRQVDHLVRLVDDLMDVSKINRGLVELRPEVVELQDVLGKAVEMASYLLEQKKHRLTINVPRIAWYGDPARLAQVVANLLTNAARYTPPGGNIELTVVTRNEEIEIFVKDDGMGISESLLPNIFDLFVQGSRNADRAEGGLGIGLALVKNLVQLHGGRVAAETAGRGLGSKFIITLPMTVQRNDLLPQPALASEVPPGNGKNVLVVDDNEDAAESLAEFLRAVGHIVTVAYDPVQAIEKATTVRPVVVILDIGLPGMDGYELAERLSALDIEKRCRFVALTGYGQEWDKQRSAQAGFVAHLVKPVDVHALQQLLGADLSLPQDT